MRRSSTSGLPETSRWAATRSWCATCGWAASEALVVSNPFSYEEIPPGHSGASPGLSVLLVEGSWFGDASQGPRALVAAN